VSAVDHALCSYAEKLRLHSSEMGRADIEMLRKAGLDDRAIHDATQVTAYFKYINRAADALGRAIASKQRIRNNGVKRRRIDPNERSTAEFRDLFW
jgi:uncharacterized protein YciW